MQKSKLIGIIRTLDGKELDRLREFLASDFFHREEDLRRLYDWLIPFAPAYTSPRLNKRQLFRDLFPGETYDDKQVRYLMSRLNQLVEQFLAIERAEAEPHRHTLYLLEELSRRGLEKAYRQAGRRLERSLGKDMGNSSRYFLAQYQWAEIREEHFARKRLRKFDESIQNAAAHLDRFYYLNRLRISCGMLDRQHILQGGYNIHLSPSWIRHLEEQNFLNEPVLQLYYTIFKALSREEDERCFEELKASMAGAVKTTPLHDLRDIYLFAINYCARKIRQGRTTYVEEALLLYRRGIEEGILIEDGVLSPWAFTNVVKLSLRMQRYDEIETFIENYAPLLPDEFRANALLYNRAELYYYTGRFEEAQEELLGVAYNDLNYYLGARVLLAKIYYETDTEEPLLALLASFTIFLRRNKELSNNLKNTYLNFCKLLFQIVSKPPTRLQGVLERIRDTELLTDRNWLEETCRAAMS